MSALSTGTVIAWTSQISDKILNGELGFAVTVDDLGWIGSLMPLGAAFVALFTGSLSDIIGRKISMLLGVIPITAGWALILWAQSVSMVFIGRILCGAVAGMYCVLAPMYSTEISEKKIRGALGCFTQLNIAFGILIASILGSYLDIQSYTIICACLPLIFGAIFVFMPESPFYLVKRNNEESAKQSLKFFRGNNYDINKDLQEIKFILKERESFSFSSVKASLKTKAARKSSLIALFLMLFRVFCGVDAITAYTSYILKYADTDIDSKTATIIIFSLQVITGIIQAVLVDYAGRKILLLLSIVVTTVTTLIIGVVIYCLNHDMIDPTNVTVVGYIPLIGLILFYMGYALGLGPIPWMILSEIFPQELKSLGSSVANFVSWISSFIVVKLFLVIEDEWGREISFIVLSVISFVGIFCILFTVHETKGKALSQIQEELNR